MYIDLLIWNINKILYVVVVVTCASIRFLLQLWTYLQDLNSAISSSAISCHDLPRDGVKGLCSPYQSNMNLACFNGIQVTFVRRLAIF